MYKKVYCTCKVVVLLIKPIFLTFSLPLPSSDVKIRSDEKNLWICPSHSQLNSKFARSCADTTKKFTEKSDHLFAH